MVHKHWLNIFLLLPNGLETVTGDLIDVGVVISPPQPKEKKFRYTY